jgi:hypothetical protein
MRRRDGEDQPPGPGRNPTVDFRGERRTNETHVSPRDPQAKLYRKADSHPAKLCYMGHVLMEHRSGLPVDVEVTQADGYAERAAAFALLDRDPSATRRTVAADKAYDTADFVEGCHVRGITPHVAMNITARRDSAIDNRTSRHNSCVASQRICKRAEEGFGWGKDGRPMRKMKVLGLAKVGFVTTSMATQDMNSMSRRTGQLENELAASEAPAIAAITFIDLAAEFMSFSTAC